ncbi:MAG: DNA repair protein RadA [Candidatus Neomarinimicrobiota bacterium]
MARTSTRITFLCSECGADSPKWFGKCPACGEWGTLKEYRLPGEGKRTAREPRESVPLTDILVEKEAPRTTTGIPEVDRVLGGGFLPASVVLLGGNPGIGKSTLALQMVANLSHPVLYISAEESEEQIAIRARRLGVDSKHLILTGENRWEAIGEHLSLQRSRFFIVDSIQTIYTDSLDSLPGTLSQLRECGQRILDITKTRGMIAVVIGHVTKEGVIAGPKMLEHMVDTVLYLEGDMRHDYRILRAVKNRFGPTNEIGVFEMTSRGLKEVANPSELFLAERKDGVSGSAVLASVEGSRPILVEVQALVSNASFGTPQRNVTGFDLRRLAMLLAVLEKRLGFPMGTKDVFVNFVGGMRIDEPSADLAVISAVASSFKDRPISPGTALAGEVGLAGELRSVSRMEERIREAKQLQFGRFVGPASSLNKVKRKISGISVRGAESVESAFEILF